MLCLYNHTYYISYIHTQQKGKHVDRLTDKLTNLALSSTPAMMPAMKAAQLSCPISGGTDTKALVTGLSSWIISEEIDRQTDR